MNILQSIMSRYLILILSALALWPVIPAVYYSPHYLFNSEIVDHQVLDEMWKRDAAALKGRTEEQIQHHLQTIQEAYPKAQLFWIDGQGQTHFLQGRLDGVPEQWTFTDTLVFIEENKLDTNSVFQKDNAQDTYTITALIGNDPKQGMMVFQIPISATNLLIQAVNKDYWFIAVFFGVNVAFLLLSWLFFYNIRKRLIHLQSAMTVTGQEGVPEVVPIKRMDEIGKLERSFNEMIGQLKSGRERERKEEQLRKQLVANISHDLRTPLTVIRQHVYSAQRDSISPRARESLQIVEGKLGDMDKMIHNLLSFTLLSAGKLPIEMRDTDVLEELRNAIAEWYPVFESHGFEVDIDLPESSLIWRMDPLWFRNIVDNLFQNIVRHADSGKYVGLATAERHGSLFMVIKDKGKGFEHESQAKGAGIGLSIVSLMVREMSLQWELVSSSDGTCIFLGNRKKAPL